MGRVTIGKGTDHERFVPIPTFRAFRATYAGVIVGGAFDQFQEVIKAVARFEREYAAENPMRDTREERAARAARLRSALGDTEELLGNEERLRERVGRDNREEWDDAEEAERSELLDTARRNLTRYAIELRGGIAAAERAIDDMGERSYVEYPGVPDEWQVYATGFTAAMNKMPGELEKLLGLVVISNADLEEVYNEHGRDGLDERCQELGRELLMQGELEEVITLMAEAGEVIYAQLEKARSALGKLRALYARATKQTETTTKTSTPEPTTGSTPSSPDSSTSSPPPIPDGPEETSSSESPGASSAPSGVVS